MKEQVANNKLSFIFCSCEILAISKCGRREKDNRKAKKKTNN